MGNEYTDKKCPICESNFLKVGQIICDTCIRQQSENAGAMTSGDRTAKQKKHYAGISVDSDFTAARKGHAYGSVAKDIYKKFCESIGWDVEQAWAFGSQQNLFAPLADSDRTRDVWFILHYNFEFDTREIDKSGGSINTITEGGQCIYEERKGDRNEDRNDRIVFVKENGLYIFYGVYRYKGFDEKKRRVFEKYSDIYPVQSETV